MIRKIFIFIFSLLLILTVWLFSQNNQTANFKILDITMNGDDEIEIVVEGYKKSKLKFTVNSYTEKIIIPVVPSNNSDVLISVINLEEQTYYLVVKENEEIKKASVSISNDLINEFKKRKISSIWKKEYEDCYTLYPLFFGCLKESYKDLEKTKNINVRLYTLENDNFKFDFIMNANYYVDAVDNEKAYGTKSKLSKLEYYFNLANISVNSYNERWYDIDVDTVSDFFKLKLKPELHMSVSPSWISRYLPMDLNVDVYYNEDGVIKKYNRYQAPEIIDINNSVIKYNDFIDEYEVKTYSFNNLKFDGLFPKLSGKILIYGFEIN